MYKFVLLLKNIYAYLQKQQEKKSFEIILQKNLFHSEESFAKSNIAYVR